jgi:hypothetical protein
MAAAIHELPIVEVTNPSQVGRLQQNHREYFSGNFDALKDDSLI